MEVRLVEKEDLRRVIKKRQISEQEIETYQKVEPENYFQIQYKVKKQSFFGLSNKTYWRTLTSMQDKQEAEEAFDWVVDNDSIGTVTKTLKTAEIDNGS